TAPRRASPGACVRKRRASWDDLASLGRFARAGVAGSGPAGVLDSHRGGGVFSAAPQLSPRSLENPPPSKHRSSPNALTKPVTKRSVYQRASPPCSAIATDRQSRQLATCRRDSGWLPQDRPLSSPSVNDTSNLPLLADAAIACVHLQGGVYLHYRQATPLRIS